jgi:hypothetical protein
MDFQSVINVAKSTVLNLGIVASALIVLIGVGWSVWYFFLRNRFNYNYVVRIWEKDQSSGNVRERYDKGGILVDGDTHNKRFFLKKSNVGLDCNNIPWIFSDKARVVYLLQLGIKNYKFVNPKFSENPGFEIKVGEEDLNWAINAYEKQKIIFQHNWLKEILPYAALFFTGFVMIIIFYFFFKNVGVLRDVAVAFQEAAKSMEAINAGTVVIGG